MLIVIASREGHILFAVTLFALPFLIFLTSYIATKDISLKWCLRNQASSPESKGTTFTAWLFFGLCAGQLCTTAIIYALLFLFYG